MCESTVYIQNSKGSAPYFEHLDKLVVEGDTVRIVDLFGESKTLHGKVKRFSLIDHKVIVESTDRSGNNG
jgi:predicted RNA-binding protein